MLDRAARQWSCIVPAFCFMPDHVHIVLYGAGPDADLWKGMVLFKQLTGYWLSQHCPGASWQKDFHDHILRQDDDVAAHVRYVLDNPCRKGIVANWEDYPNKGAIGWKLEDVVAGLPFSGMGRRSGWRKGGV